MSTRIKTKKCAVHTFPVSRIYKLFLNDKSKNGEVKMIGFPWNKKSIR